MTTDQLLEHRLAAAYRADMPPGGTTRLDERLAAAVDLIRVEAAAGRRATRHGRARRRVMAALAVAAVLVGAAATPGVREAFDGWFGGEFDSVWDRATVIDEAVVDQGYRVTLVRAYADPIGLYLAMTVEDLEGRDVSEAHVGMPVVRAADGTELPGDMGLGGGPGGSEYSEGIFRYRVPDDLAAPGSHRLRAEVTGVAIRAHDPPEATDGFPYESLWTTVSGSWSFTFDLEFFGRLEAQPDGRASASGIDVTWTDLVVTPAATVITLEVTGLEPTAPDWGWSFGGRVEHDGHRMEWMTSDGILDAGPGPQTITFEMEQGRDDLSGTWTITIDEFQTDIPNPDSDVTTEKVIIEGPWVLTFEGPPPS